MMAKPTARLDLTRDEMECITDGLMRVMVHFDNLAHANPTLAKAYENARERYNEVWCKVYDRKVMLPNDSDA